MRKLSIVTTCVVTVVVVMGLLFGTPYYTLWRARDAANARDADTLSSYVDYPAVRDSLKTSLHDQMARQMDKQRSNPFGALALALGGWVSDRVVEALLTPEAVAAMLRGDSTGLPPAPGAPAPDQVVPQTPQAPQAPQQSSGTPPSSNAPSNDGKPQGADTASPRTITRTEFQDFNHFLVHVSRSDRPERVVTFTLTRRNLVQWRLSAIALPPL
ncbi:hypothetical protein PMO31116_00604 [Pandoraea morbifera]|uniref:DUF2939 domain-containing protein n=1 Tax=Pandoraea morbifera TaxID=2508300 RepID=A0A5E4S8S5_9BURK|nr:DUF2939 domain-containing protein [Pandoraea morbifera]VVD70974.1 hypothetical protein PMO31116_00604 [Pandoraea morbifera]